MVLHLISNAISYTDQQGQITTYLRQVDTESLELTVKDTGIGITQPDLPHIFDRFYRVDTARSTDTGGNGLGLSIVKQIVELHHGTIAVQSFIGEGSEFTVQLPIYKGNSVG